MKLPLLGQREAHWDHKFDELSEYNSEKMKARGLMYRVNDSPSERLLYRNVAQNWLDSLSPEFVERMKELQREYDARLTRNT